MRRRHLIALRGSREETAAATRAALSRRPGGGDDDLWVGPEHTPPRAVRRLLGRAYDAVVLDLHEGLDADLLGQAHGFVRAGGALILRLPSPGTSSGPLPFDARLAAHPFTAADVGDRFRLHFERALARAERSHADALGPVDHAVNGSPDQAAAVAALTDRLSDATPSLTTLVADRGRGKSSALGLALRALADTDHRVVVTAEDPRSAAEVFRFATGHPEPPIDGPLRFVPPMALATGDHPADVIVVDEAAQLPVPVLQQLVRRHPDARVAFATTARGYEGTGRGFMLRFLAWLETDPRPRRHLTLETPIRWAPDDPVERFVFDALLLDARPAPVAADAMHGDDVVYVALDRDALVRDERGLADVFGLLVHAHYRTTPEDLHRILDAPNLALHALRTRRSGRIVAVNLVASEGALPAGLREDVARGRHRLRAHALADALVAHLGHTDAGALTMLRSVRIATHPDLRRRRLASTLIRAVERASDADLFGTVFGATAELLAFRRSLGYELFRVSASRGARTGEPAALMMRPNGSAATALLQRLRGDLARDLPHQLALLEADGELLLDPALTAALQRGLPVAAPLTAGERDATVAAYLAGPRTFESVASAVTAFVTAHANALGALPDPRQAALLHARAVACRSWGQAARLARYPSVPAAMRAFRRAVRALAEVAAPHVLEVAP